MFFEQFYLGCLAHASYMFGSEGEAVVVDPQRDVELYLDAAAKHGLTIRHIFETHLHADFVSGHRELAARTGATIYVGATAGATYPHVDVRDGFELRVKNVIVKVLETPGHTPESICLLLTDLEKSPQPFAVLTGDTLFLGDVGRPDLSKTHTPKQLAAMMYDSLHGKLMPLADDVLVYPAHGAGSLCGRKMRSDSSSTIGTERLTNYALQIKSKEEFIEQMTANLPARPEYFLDDAAINRDGAGSLTELPKLQPVTSKELHSLLENGGLALDVRAGDLFATSHVPGSVNIALSGQFASWAGIVLGTSARPVLIADTMDQVQEARLRLARIGLEGVAGYLEGGIEAWQRAGYPLQQVPQITAQDLRHRLRDNAADVIDVRREGEWESGHIAEAEFHPLDGFAASLPSIASERPVAVHCKSGYRSMIACSLLQRAGHTNVINLIGGFDAWQQAESSPAPGSVAAIGA